MGAVEALKCVLKIKIKQGRKTTQITHKSNIKMLISWLQKNGHGNKPIFKINKNIMQQYVNDMLINEDFAPKTINNKIGVYDERELSITRGPPTRGKLSIICSHTVDFLLFPGTTGNIKPKI